MNQPVSRTGFRRILSSISSPLCGIMFAFLLLFPIHALARDLPPQDHGGADLIVADGDEIWGTHTNIGQFVVPEGAALKVAPYVGGTIGRGTVEVRAASIELRGSFDGGGAGSGGTGGGGAGPDGVGGFNRNGYQAGSPYFIEFDESNPPQDFPPDNPPPLVYQSFRGYIGGWGYPAGGNSSGYMTSYGNGDHTTGLETKRGSGGNGGDAGDDGVAVLVGVGMPFNMVGYGGGGGGCGGGEIRLFASNTITVSGTIDVSGWMGGNADGKNGGNALPPEEGLSGSGLAGHAGPGGGGGMLLHAPTVTLEDGSRLTSLGGSGLTQNGGTIKIFAKQFDARLGGSGSNPEEVTIEAGRLFFSSQPGLDTGWMVY